MVTKSSFCHNLTCASNQKTYFTKNVRLGVIRKEMLPKPLNMQPFGHKTLISSQPYCHYLDCKLKLSLDYMDQDKFHHGIENHDDQVTLCQHDEIFYSEFLYEYECQKIWITKLYFRINNNYN